MCVFYSGEALDGLVGMICDSGASPGIQLGVLSCHLWKVPAEPTRRQPNLDLRGNRGCMTHGEGTEKRNSYAWDTGTRQGRAQVLRISGLAVP